MELSAIEKIAKLFESIPIAIFLAIWATLSVILFIPEGAARAIALDGFRVEYKLFLGPAFLLVTFVFIARVAMVGEGWLKSVILEKRQQKNFDKILRALTGEEKAFLGEYIHSGQNTVYSNIANGVAGGLEAKGVVYRASNISFSGASFPYNLQPWARERLQADPALLQ